MKHRTRNLLLSLAVTAAFSGCSSADDPAALVASAKDYIAKRDYKASVIQLKNALQQQPDNKEARYLLGYSALESGDLVTAEIELKKAADLGFESEDLQVVLARTLLAKGDVQGVVNQFGNKTLAAPKAQAELRAIVGTAELRRGRLPEAKAAFDQALGLDAGNVTANLGVARLAAANRDLAGALSRTDKALATAPSSYEALTLKAEILAAQGQADAATKAYRAAIEAAPTAVEPRLSLISHLVRQRSLDEAAKEVEALRKFAGHDLRTAYAHAMVLAEQRKFPEAKEAILQVLKVAPEHVPSLTLAGMAAFQTGAYAEAEAHLRKALFKAPETFLAKRLLAATHLRMGQTEVALGEVKELLAKAPNDPAVLALAGEASLASGDTAGAARYYERAKTLAPDNVRLQTRLAQVRFAAGDAAKGFEELEAAASANADDYQADLALVAAHLRQRQPDKALEALKSLEKKQPNNALTHHLRGLALLLKRDVKDARASFERAVSLNPTYMPSIAALARLDLRERKTDEAKKRYEAVLKKEPNNEQALLGLAVLLRVSGAKPEEIERLLKQSIAASPASPRARAALVNHYLRAKDIKAALAAAQEAAAALPNSPAAIQMLGITQIAAGEHRQAVSTLTRLAEMTPKSPQPHVLLAGAHMAAKQPDEAIKSLRAALNLDPNLQTAQRDIAAIYVATGRADQAVREARAVQKEKPQSPFGYVLEGEIHIAQKKWDAAEKVYREAIRKFDTPTLVARTHAVMTAGGKPKEADAMAEQWIKAHPKDGFVLNYMAERDLRSGQYKSAVTRYQQALERGPENALLLNNLAWAMYQLKQPKAIEVAERAHELAPENPAIMDTLGTILVDTGDAERGLELLGHAAEQAPQNYQIRLNFAKALLKANRKDAARKELEPLAKLDSRHPVQQEAAKLLSGL